MTSIFDFSKYISQLKREKKYGGALLFFKEHRLEFKKKENSNNEFLISDIITCLKYTNQFDAGIKFLNYYGIEINSETKERILTSYGWLLWSKYRTENSNEN